VAKNVDGMVAIWAIYIVFHILLSALLHYDSLIPAWRLHA